MRWPKDLLPPSPVGRPPGTTSVRRRTGDCSGNGVDDMRRKNVRPMSICCLPCPSSLESAPACHRSASRRTPRERCPTGGSSKPGGRSVLGSKGCEACWSFRYLRPTIEGKSSASMEYALVESLRIRSVEGDPTRQGHCARAGGCTFEPGKRSIRCPVANADAVAGINRPSLA